MMKTLDFPKVMADPVISEVRHSKTQVAQRYGFDVIAMVRALRQIDEEEQANLHEITPSEAQPQQVRPLTGD